MCKTMSILNVQNYVHYWMWNTKGECAKQCLFWMCKTMFIFWMFKTKSFVEGSKLWSYTQLFWMSKWMCKISSFYRGVYFLCLRMWKSMWMSKKLYQSYNAAPYNFYFCEILVRLFYIESNIFRNRLANNRLYKRLLV